MFKGGFMENQTIRNKSCEDFKFSDVYQGLPYLKRSSHPKNEADLLEADGVFQSLLSLSNSRMASMGCFTKEKDECQSPVKHRGKKYKNFGIPTPELLKDYRYLKVIGEGSYGKIYLARHVISGKTVAIKALKNTGDFKSIELFKRESEILKSVKIDGVPKFVDLISSPDGISEYYLIQEYVNGKSLLDIIEAEGSLPEKEVFDILLRMAVILDALETKYQPPIVHRDIKPSNILITDWHDVALIDFGAVANPARKNVNSTIAGTQGYMAPEQMVGDCTVESDYYALGATAVHMLTGTSPCDMDVVEFKLQYKEVIAQKHLNVSQSMTDLLDKLLAVRPEDRPRNSKELKNCILQGRYKGTISHGGIAPYLHSALKRHSILRILAFIPLFLWTTGYEILSNRTGRLIVIFLLVLIAVSIVPLMMWFVFRDMLVHKHNAWTPNLIFFGTAMVTVLILIIKGLSLHEDKFEKGYAEDVFFDIYPNLRSIKPKDIKVLATIRKVIRRSNEYLLYMTYLYNNNYYYATTSFCFYEKNSLNYNPKDGVLKKILEDPHVLIGKQWMIQVNKKQEGHPEVFQSSEMMRELSQWLYMENVRCKSR